MPRWGCSTRSGPRPERCATAGARASASSSSPSHSVADCARYPLSVETLPGHLRRISAGQDLFQAEMMSRNHRQRILAALAEVVSKRGYQGTTVELIIKRAGVARATFYENFANREDCLLACFDESLQALRTRISAAATAEQEWPDQLRAGLTAFLEYVAANPAQARTCMIEVVTAGSKGLERYEEALQSFEPALRRGRELAATERALSEPLEDSLIGGIVWMVHQRLLHSEFDEIPGLLPTMLEFTLAPYLGKQSAAQFAAST